ncbi:MAG: ABC transporter permease [Betaproteobacteria bacterium]|nr:ABC transporter permease [Betaproteobacteria bacterium]
MSKVESGVSGAPSPAYADYLKRERRSRFAVRGSQAALLVVFLILWEVLPRAQIINPLFTSYPSALIPTFIELLKETPQQQSILAHAWSTTFATVIGFTLAMALGTLAAAALWYWQTLYRILDPYLVVANAMPKTAFVPIFYIWLGASLSIYGMSLAISLFITILILYNGFQEVDPNKIKLARTFGASRAQIFRKVIFPGSVPTMFAALKVNVGLSLVGVVVGELQSASVGLGYLIQYGSQVFKLNIVMTAIAILALLSVLLYAMIYFLEAIVARRR